MRQSWRLLVMASTLAAWGWAGSPGAPAQAVPQREPQLVDAAQLVRQLGDPGFSTRKHAMEQLVDLGAGAIAALEQGVQSNDREVRFRSQHALEIVRQHDFHRRLRAFAAGQDAEETYELPGWTLFRQAVGDGLEARRLFVEMQEAEPKLLQTLERSPERAAEALVDRLEELQQTPRLGQKLGSVPLGTIATLLFVSNQDRSDSVALAVQNLAAFYRQDVFAAAIESGAQREILRKMLGTWIENARSWDAFHAMLLAMQFDLPQGLAPAKRVLESDVGDPNQAVYRGFALQTIARFGNPSHLPIVEPLLEDASPYGGALAVSGKAKYQTQIRDIALAAAVHLAKQDPKKFGLTRIKPSSTQVFNTNSVAFEDDAQREEAIQKWRASRAEHP
jgi:hypothetical protein